MRAARRGEALAGGSAGARAEFAALLDRVALAAALAGSYAGFDGRCLEARASDAWCRAAARQKKKKSNMSHQPYPRMSNEHRRRRRLRF